MDEDGMQGFELLETSECIALLRQECIGRVGFVGAGWPRVLPVNYAVAEDGTVVFRTTGTSILATIAGRPVTFEVDGFDAPRRVGWSVCVEGEGREITEAADARAERLHRLDVVTWAPGNRSRWFAIPPDRLTGRRLPLSVPAEDIGWFAGIVS